MNDYILFMHADAAHEAPDEMWGAYFAMLRGNGVFEGGSAIGSGEVMRKDEAAAGVTSHLTGYIRIRARDMAEARSLVIGNPVFECGGSVEIRELPRD